MGFKRNLIKLGRPLNDFITTRLLEKYYRSDQSVSGTGSAKRVLIIAPHVDDETIGLGGTIKKHKIDGAEIVLVYVTDGSKSFGAVRGKDLIAARKAEAQQVQSILGIDKILYLDLPDQEADSNEYSRAELLRILSSTTPDMIYCTTFVDCHSDHLAAGRILSDALKQLDMPNVIIRLYEINCPVPKEEINCIVDISESFSDKLKAVEVFGSQTLNFDGFLELNRLKAAMVKDESVRRVETFIELNGDEFTSQFDRLDVFKHLSYRSLFTQVSTRDKLLWAVLRNLAKKRKIYQRRYGE